MVWLRPSCLRLMLSLRDHPICQLHTGMAQPAATSACPYLHPIHQSNSPASSARHIPQSRPGPSPGKVLAPTPRYVHDHYQTFRCEGSNPGRMGGGKQHLRSLQITARAEAWRQTAIKSATSAIRSSPIRQALVQESLSPELRG